MRPSGKQLRRPILLQTGLGVGDVLLVTALARQWAANGRRPIVVESRYPELFRYSPDVLSVVRQGSLTRWVSSASGRRIVWRASSGVMRLHKALSTCATYPNPCRGRHILNAMAESVGLALDDDVARPFIYLSTAELVAASQYAGSVVVQSSSSTYWTPNKNWVSGRMQTVVDGLRENGWRVLQLGSDDDPLQGVADFRQTNLRQAASILSCASLFVGLEGGLVHLARAVNTTSLVIHTGFSRPQETGYRNNINIRAETAGDSCWHREPCDHCRASAEAVSADEVLSAALARLRTLS